MSREPTVPPPEVAEYYQTYVDKWLPAGWLSRLQYVNDEFQDGWSIDVFLPGSERDPQIPNIPADGSVPHFMLNKNVYSYQKGMEAGQVLAADLFIIAAMSKAAEDSLKLVTSLRAVKGVSYSVQKLSDPRTLQQMLEATKDSN